VGSDDDIMQLTKKQDPHHEPIGPKPPDQIKKTFFFFILNYMTPLVNTGFEQLSSSICFQVMAGQSLA